MLLMHTAPLPSAPARPLTASSPCVLPSLTPPPLLLAKWWSSAALAPPLPLGGEANGAECCALDGVVRWNNPWPHGADLSADPRRLCNECYIAISRVSGKLSVAVYLDLA